MQIDEMWQTLLDNFEHLQASPGALSTNSCGMRDKTQHGTDCLIERHYTQDRCQTIR